MISYSQSSVFSQRELDLFRAATTYVEAVPDLPGLRCHEVARAIGVLLGLEVQDGNYGMVEHSWLWLDRWCAVAIPRILDVYAVGSLPQVQLVDNHWKLHHKGAYTWAWFGANRRDIDQGVVDQLVIHCRGVA